MVEELKSLEELNPTAADQVVEENLALLLLMIQRIRRRCQWFDDWLCTGNKQYNQRDIDQK